MAIMTRMAKQLHIINDNGKVSVRELYDAAKHGRMNPEKVFMRHERSPFLEYVLGKFNERYVQFTAHAFGQTQLEEVTAWMSKWAHHGVRLATGVNKSIEFWKFLCLSWTDKGSMIMIPSKSEVESLDSLGVHVIDPDKAPKYLKRAFAPHEHAVFGKIIHVEEEADGQVIAFELESGYVGLWRNVDLDKMPSDLHRACADGQNRWSPEFLAEVGVKARNLNTYGGKGTTFGPAGLAKGYGHAQPGLKFSIVSYGAKKQVVYDDFFFGILGSLKPGNKFKSDNQSLTNFDEYANGFALEASKDFMEELSEAMNDKDKMRGMFLSYLRAVVSNEEGREETEEETGVDRSEDLSATEKWMVINALESGMDMEIEPSLWRRVYGHFMSEVMQLDRARIPFDKYGIRCDIMPDPRMFDAYGDVYPENTIIPKGCCVAMDVPIGPVVTSRQPNGHAMERWDCMNLHMPEFDIYTGARRIIYGSHDLIENLNRKNGEDMDDTERVIHDPAMVKHIREQVYPVTEKMVVTEPKKRLLGRYYNIVSRTIENLSTASFTAADGDRAMERARTMRMKLGQVVNTITLDTLLSGKHKENMIKYISKLIQDEPDKDRKIFYLDKRDWLASREDYQLADVATNLEAVIDFCVQSKGDPRQFAPMMDKVNAVRMETQVYPMQMAKAGTGFMGQGKISPMKKLGFDYILAPSLLCEAMLDVEAEREAFMNDLRAHEWECITPVPLELESMFGFSRDISDIAYGIQKWFNPKAVAAMSLPAKYSRKAYNNILFGTFHECVTEGDPKGRCPVPCPQNGKLLEDGLKQIMESYDIETRLFIAVELKRRTQRNTEMKIDENGQVRRVPDGVFGNNVVFNYYLQALDQAGLTGKYVPVDLDQVSISRNVRNQIFEVVVENGIVLRKTDHFWIGTVDADNGEYRLVNGMLEIRKPDIQLTIDWMNANQIDEDGNMPNAGEIDIN